MKNKLLLGLLMSLLSVSCWAGSLDALLQKGDEFWQAGELDKAQVQFEQATQEYSQDALAHSKLAGFYLIRQAYQNSITHYQHAISLQQEDVPAQTKSFIGLGLSYMHSERSSLAAAAFQEALRLEPQRQAELGPLLEKLQPKGGE